MSTEIESAVDDQVGKLNSLLSNMLGTYNVCAPSLDPLNDSFTRARESVINSSVN